MEQEVLEIVETEVKASREYPMVALRGLVVFPQMNLNFDVNRKISIQAVEEAMNGEQLLFLAKQIYASTEEPQMADMEEIGVLARVRQITRLPNQNLRVLVEGLERCTLREAALKNGHLTARVEPCIEDKEDLLESSLKEAMFRQLEIELAEYLRYYPRVGKGIVEFMEKTDSISRTIDFIGVTLPLPVDKKQQLLSTVSLQERFERLNVILTEETYIGKARVEFSEKVKQRVDKQQKEYVLREQLKVIREELGEDTTGSDADMFMEKLESLDASDEVKSKIKKQISRLRSLMGNGPEASVERNYIETLLDMPWNKGTVDLLDLKRAEHVLDAKHYGMEKVKERILEFLAVRAYNQHGRSPIICLVGPPGTGKSSIARSIADALGKKYVRISLGGVHDEAEIRGHRKTYIGAMPGRVATGIKQAGVKNPVMLLDEIDKVGVDHRGDAFAALLEVLDPEQNKAFRDNYIEIPLDLSEVFFVATANDISTIPTPLLDRMDVIEVNSYTANEKFHIAKKHLVPKQVAEHGLEQAISFTDGAIRKMIMGYTREAGVRNLERTIGELCRKAARKLLTDGDKQQLKVTATNISAFLGKEKYHQIEANKKPEIGIVRGLAWTSVGGDTLEIQVNTMPGEGKLKLTGQMGEVMQESAQIAYTYVRSIGEQYGVEVDYFDTHDFHLHIPAGAVPKDGPSAGITMATAMLSAFAERPVDHLIAMTGEINLRGKVMPIGGLKEKLLAANMAGMKRVLIPEENRKDLAELSGEIIGDMEVMPVMHMNEVLSAAFVG
ncbi:MAG: endopeptidase La [Lachnospiraceae bacterium]|nr:endopeptidase La [Lachnospiraceae bacterium]